MQNADLRAMHEALRRRNRDGDRLVVVGGGVDQPPYVGGFDGQDDYDGLTGPCIVQSSPPPLPSPTRGARNEGAAPGEAGPSASWDRTVHVLVPGRTGNPTDNGDHNDSPTPAASPEASDGATDEGGAVSGPSASTPQAQPPPLAHKGAVAGVTGVAGPGIGIIRPSLPLTLGSLGSLQLLAPPPAGGEHMAAGMSMARPSMRRKVRVLGPSPRPSSQRPRSLGFSVPC